ncbi:MAG TPA: N-methyl-L-tryptophan oxidase [Gemmatimonadaceae bacterium]|nr:N-methyl-L-tryptophan oxidase [Gemmatimonadaceae bacterium]
MTRTDFEYIVVGLGGLGSAAAYWLSRRAGADVLGLEQFELGHERGESQDHSRIIRLSYHTPGYVRLAMRAYECWDTVSTEAGEPLVLVTGGLDFAPRESGIPIAPYMHSLRACGVPFEHLDAAEIMKRWPQFTLGDEIHGIYQSRGGIAKAAKGNAAHQRLARAHGATLVDRAPVTAIAHTGNEYAVTAGGTTWRARRLVIAAGPWSNGALGHLGVRLPLVITREQVTYFATPHLAEFAPERFPVWIWMDDPCWYGFPAFGEPATKAAQDCGGKPTTGDTRDFEVDPENAAGVERFLATYIPRALGPVHRIKTCLYTLTPDRDFIIDAVPGHAGAYAAIGAGHAYKFASVIGRVLSELAIDGRTPSDLSAFGFGRPILHEKDPPVHYMV